MKLTDREAEAIAEECKTFILGQLGASRIPTMPMDVIGSEIAELIGDIEDRIENKVATYVEEHSANIDLEDLWE